MPHDLASQFTTFAIEPGAARPALSVVGLGYVGAVSVACFAAMGHQVVGVDLDREKVDAIANGRCPLIEDGLDELMAGGVVTGRLSACSAIDEAVAATETTFICVGTPSRPCGAANLSALELATRDVGRALGKKTVGYHLVVVRSTVPVATTRHVVLPILEAESGLRCGEDFGLCFQPEFLREGVAVSDFFAPPKTVVGGIDARSTDMLARLYAGLDAPLIRTSLEAAEMAKYVDNAWHAVKVVFANEVGRLCQELGTDSHEVMGIFVQDTKLNLSPCYLKPGFAFGGSCLPKDVRSICSMARKRGLDLPLMRSVLPSNDAQLRHALRLIEAFRGRRVGFLGVTFKSGTDDLRESPQVDLIGRLLGTDAEVRVFDRNVTPAGLALAAAHSEAASATTRSALCVLPSLLVADAEDLVGWAEVVVVAHATAEFAQTLRRSRDRGAKQVLDLVRLSEDLREGPGYAGVCW